jgi:xylose isomerase
VQEALAASKVAELAQPTFNEGESYTDFLGDRSAFEDYDADAAGKIGYGFVKLHQLAIDHVLRAG